MKQKTDDECYCCKEHELLVDRMVGLVCFTDIPDIEEFVAHRPSLKMAFVDAMIKKYVRGPEELSNRRVFGGGSLSQEHGG